MIQVCSRCGTRWNVRDRQRSWCPRCQGALLAPSSDAPDPRWAARPSNAQASQSGQRTPQRLPQGYRWIAVRPGAAPPPRRVRGPLGPTPRYATIPRWGLTDHLDGQFGPEAPQQEMRSGPSVAMVRATLVVTMVLLGVAALAHIVRYALLLINRTTLLTPWVAGVVTWSGVAASVLALFAIIASVVVLVNWLIARRGLAFAHRDTTDPRSAWEMRVGCLVPLVNLFWAPVYLIELANAEGRLSRLRTSIVTWWCVWIFSTLVSLFSIATSFTSDAQGIADNTVTTIVAYLAALAALLLVQRVWLGFERRPVDRPVKRWVIVADESSPPPTRPAAADAAVDEPEVPSPIDDKQREPAA